MSRNSYRRGKVPWTIIDEAMAVAVALDMLSGVAVHDRNVTGLPLPSLCKGFWLGKGFDYDIDLIWTANTGSYSASGTIKGSGSVVLDPNAIPPTRTYPGFANHTTVEQSVFPLSGQNVSGTTSVIFNGVTYHNSFSPNNVGSVDWMHIIIDPWYTGIRGTYGNGNHITVDRSVTPAIYRTAADFNVDGNVDDPTVPPGAAPSFQTGAGAGTTLPTPVDFVITVDGKASSPIPITISSGATVTPSGSGHIYFNVNSFW